MVLRWIGLLVAGTGTGLAVWALRTIGLARFIGRPAQPLELILRGPYLLVRHPFHLGALFCLLGLLVATRDVIVGIVFGIALVAAVIGIAVEERVLVVRFGEAYRRYREAVPMLIPRRQNRPMRSRPDSDSTAAGG